VDVGIVLPNGAPGVDGPTLLEWARRAEARGFASVGVIGRIAYPTYEELTTLAAVAGATERVRLLTTTLLAPLRDPVLLAKQAATIDRLSGGRLVLGLSAGMRPDDFLVTGTSFEGRGKRFDAMLEKMHALWRGDPAGAGTREACPQPTHGRVPIYFGALTPSPRIVRRIARWGDGFIAVGSPAMVAPMIDALSKAWAEAGREGKLRLVGASYFALADPATAERNILDYYSDFYPQLGQAAAAAMIRTPDVARRMLAIHEDAGFDQFNFSAAGTDPSDVDRLADAVL
jgi:alkanesulfonate monooxygenase SsuD/methylene tetrahydromethanopterin reductase-like flavin-dependent oxidoreductase (luciferase family)